MYSTYCLHTGLHGLRRGVSGMEPATSAAQVFLGGGTHDGSQSLHLGRRTTGSGGLWDGVRAKEEQDGVTGRLCLFLFCGSKSRLRVILDAEGDEAVPDVLPVRECYSGS